MYQLSQEASSPLQCVLLAFKVLCFFSPWGRLLLLLFIFLFSASSLPLFSAVSIRNRLTLDGCVCKSDFFSPPYLPFLLPTRANNVRFLIIYH